MKNATQAIHEGYTPQPPVASIMPPVYQTSTYLQEAPGQHHGYEYARTQNPTREILEKVVATLEEAAFGIAFSSGCAASAMILQLFETGSHILCADDVYGGSHRLMANVFQQQLKVSFIDLTKPEELAKHLTPQTKALWIESPSNPMLKIIDLEAMVAFCKAHQLLCICDNTFATPILQKPLNYGLDIVVHSTTKYLNGHSDVIGGMVCSNDPQLAKRLRFLQNAIGAVPGPWDCWLILRGLKTLVLRMERHCQNAMHLASFLEKSTLLKKVIYPGLKSHPQHHLAKKQMPLFGGMIAIDFVGDLASAKIFLKHLKIFSLAESLGGVESLVEHPASMTHAAVPLAHRQLLGISEGLIRLSVGIEDKEDLEKDLQQALSYV